MTLTLIAEALVACLLTATIVTCYMLAKRIERLKADESAMRQTIGALVSATDTAERAIVGLRNTLGDCDRTLAERLMTAERYAADLAAQIEAGQVVMDRIGRIVATANLVAGKPAAVASVAAAAPVSALEGAAKAAAAIKARAAQRLGDQAA